MYTKLPDFPRWWDCMPVLKWFNNTAIYCQVYILNQYFYCEKRQYGILLVFWPDFINCILIKLK